MTLPRKLRLVKMPEGVHLSQQPVKSLRTLRGDDRKVPAQATRPNENLLTGMQGTTLEIIADLEPRDADAPGLRVFAGENQWAELRYNVDCGSLFLNSFRSGRGDFNASFALACEAPLPLEEGSLGLHGFVGRSSVEVFAIEGEAHLHSLTVWPLASIWRNKG